MAGFLDKESRIIDMVLTGLGRQLLSRGELKFVYWVPFDDEVDYDPYISQSGSLSPAALSSSKQDQIESALVREAVAGYRPFNSSGSDTTNVIRPMFTAPNGQLVMPRLTPPSNSSGTLELEIRQRKVQDLQVKRDSSGAVLENLGPYDRGYERFQSESMTLEFSFPGDAFPHDHKQEGVLVRVLKSGTQGFVEVDDRRDFKNNISYSNDLKMKASSGQDMTDADQE